MVKHSQALRLCGATVAALLGFGASVAQAVIGGTDDRGPLSRATVMVLSSQPSICSGIVVAPDVVLTAAHCVTGPADHRVHFRVPGGDAVLIEPAAKAVHQGYDAKAIQGRRHSIDLALVRLPEPLPERFRTATLSSRALPLGEALRLGGYGLTREGDGRSAGTFRMTTLQAVEPFGPSRILVWASDPGRLDGGVGAGACRGDSGGPMVREGATAILGVISWTSGPKGRSCGHYTQGVLLGPQRAWIDRTLAGWGREARWESPDHEAGASVPPQPAVESGAATPPQPTR